MVYYTPYEKKGKTCYILGKILYHTYTVHTHYTLLGMSKLDSVIGQYLKEREKETVTLVNHYNRICSITKCSHCIQVICCVS